MGEENSRIREQLVALVGFPVPGELVRIVEAFVERTGDFENAVWSLGHDYLDLGHGLMRSTECRYEATPVEFFPFLSTGGDGESYGYVIHAPELHLQDWPMASFVPGDDYGLTHVGDSTLLAMENLISCSLDREDADKIDLGFLRGLGIVPSVDKAENVRLLRNDHYVRPRPKVPDRWVHVMTSDGVGVLAHESRFSGRPTTTLSRRSDLSEFMRLARHSSDGGFPGDALYYLKEAWWHKYWGAGKGELRDLKKRLLAVYEELGRPFLASTLDACFDWI